MKANKKDSSTDIKQGTISINATKVEFAKGAFKASTIKVNQDEAKQSLNCFHQDLKKLQSQL